MVELSYPRLEDALRNIELTASVRRMADALPFYHGSPTELTRALIDAAGNNFHPHRISDISQIPPDILDLHARIIEFAKDVADHAGAGGIADEKSLISDFIWFLIRPLEIAERDVMKLEGLILAELSHHEALGVTSVDFRMPDAAGRAETLFGKFIERVGAYPEEIDKLMRHVGMLERIFRDPKGIALKTLGTLRDLGGMIAQLEYAARMVLKSSDNDILRAKWLEGIHTVFVDRMDPFSYAQKTYPQLHVTTPERELALPTFSRDAVRRIMNSLMRNAIAHDARKVSISILSGNDGFATVGVLFDGADIPIESRDRCDDRFTCSNWHIMKNHLVPELGPGAAITCTFIDEGSACGTLVKLTIPIGTAASTPIPADDGERPATPPSIDSIEGAHGVEADVGANSALAGAFGLVGEAQVIPLRFAMRPAGPIGKA